MGCPKRPSVTGPYTPLHNFTHLWPAAGANFHPWLSVIKKTHNKITKHKTNKQKITRRNEGQQTRGGEAKKRKTF